MESKEKNTKEKILEEALKLFAQSGYMGTSMNDIASKLGVTFSRSPSGISYCFTLSISN